MGIKHTKSPSSFQMDTCNVSISCITIAIPFKRALWRPWNLLFTCYLVSFALV